MIYSKHFSLCSSSQNIGLSRKQLHEGSLQASEILETQHTVPSLQPITILESRAEIQNLSSKTILIQVLESTIATIRSAINGDHSKFA